MEMDIRRGGMASGPITNYVKVTTGGNVVISAKGVGIEQSNKARLANLTDTVST